MGMVQVNTYLLWEENHVLIVDPGSKSHKLQETIDSQNGVVDAIVLTHGHFDHIAGVDALVKKYHCPVYINELDMAMLQDPMLNFSYQAPVVVNSPVTKPSRVKTASVPLRFRQSTPPDTVREVPCCCGMII